ncbi:MAG: endolytic transglycosylase MltG, partial [Minisyncoccia bacterium]
MLNFNIFWAAIKKLGNYLGIIIFILFIFFLVYIILNLLPANSKNSSEKFFEIKSGENVFNISRNLYEQKLIKSKLAFNVLAILSGKALDLKTGTYKLNSNFSAFKILNSFYYGKYREVQVVIPEGATSYDVDYILSQNNVLKKGELINYLQNLNLEGKLMPDTYMFFYNSSPEAVVQKMINNFNLKIQPLLLNSQNPTSTLILASMLEKEA